MSISLRLQRAQDLTTAELPTLDLWNEFLDAGDTHSADRVAQAGLDLEHLISVYPLDPANATDEEFQELQFLFSLARQLGIAVPKIVHLEERQPQPLPIIVQGRRNVPSARRAARPQR